MGQHPSAVADDGQSSIHRQSYTVRGDLYARSITASTINARVIYARRITCQKAQISRQEPLNPHNYPNTPHRSITAHTVNADTIYADEINTKLLRGYDVFVGDGEQWRAKRIDWQDRNQVGWDGREDEDSEPSDDEGDDRSRDEDRSRRKKLVAFGAAGALGLAIGGAALAYNHHKNSKKEEEEENEKAELRRREEEERLRREEEDRRRHDDDNRRRHDDDERRRREEDDRRRHEQQQQHHQPPPYQQDRGHHGGGGNFHMSSRNARIWSDGNHAYLMADCDAGGGRFQESRIDLDEIVTNRNGEFVWVHRGETGNFSGSAERWELVDGGSTLVADLRRVDGSMNRHRFNLSDRITNDHGNLRYLD